MTQRIVLTGGIASGKSTVADLLAERGAVLVDADLLAREVVAPGTDGLAAVVDRFGAGVLRPDGTLDRAGLGALVFADAAARADLNAIVHPRVRALAEARRAALAADSDAVVVEVIPLVVETGRAGDYDVVIVVDADPATQVARLRARNRLSDAEARARLAAQASRAERLAAATHVLPNAGTRAELAERVDALWCELTSP
ncbi:dephospho-CoA kinase [Propioniciclava sp.]|uniref:dephospho-CoA kinase n=1 Tax=Propioniciclava sp. TaxID=2038686 RepID=UPI00260E8A46|nr:dephospho-CoA kinase [Propioniciclava sp.]